MPTIEPALTALILSPNEALRPDAVPPRTLPVVPGQLFGVAAQQALERTLQVTQARQQFASLRRAPPRSRRPAVSTTTVPPIPRLLTRAGAPLPEGFCQPTRSWPFRQPQQNAAQGYRPPRGRRGRGGRQ